jgi:hypothetical protein
VFVPLSLSLADISLFVFQWVAPHRTQILYLAKTMFLTSWLYTRPSSVVVEAGRFAPVPPTSPISIPAYFFQELALRLSLI